MYSFIIIIDFHGFPHCSFSFIRSMFKLFVSMMCNKNATHCICDDFEEKKVKSNHPWIMIHYEGLFHLNSDPRPTFSPHPVLKLSVCFVIQGGRDLRKNVQSATTSHTNRACRPVTHSRARTCATSRPRGRGLAYACAWAGGRVLRVRCSLMATGTCACREKFVTKTRPAVTTTTKLFR